MDANELNALVESTRSAIKDEILSLEIRLSEKRKELAMLPGRKRAERSDKGQPRKATEPRIDAEDRVDLEAASA